MSNTDTNRASEDGLRKGIIGELSRVQLYAKDHPYSITATDEADIEKAADAIQSIIRTEKLKLLAEVREQVQVNQKGQFEEDSTGNVCWYLDDLVEALKELEAEL